ncbi:autophagy protein Apg9-domain-containing protein [Absidia repens]|uniref:Autophagy-related protein 9 n=1 Tax=Absidia repens TaxID=90262 RepID=A0A1X2IGY1_9FUNG|nr:autophagy protein Apg9-domain-containing protein [Absidia repens]
MAESSLLHSQLSDEEIDMDAISTKRMGKRPIISSPLANRPRFLPQHRYQQLHQYSSNISDGEDDDDESDLEAPASLLVEKPQQQQQQEELRHHQPSTSTRKRTTWQEDKQYTSTGSTQTKVSTLDRTMWRWTNVENMDDFFQKVYNYYQGKGLYCILMARLLNLLVLAFLIFYSTFLVGCVNYSEIPNRHSLSEVIIPHCYSRLSSSTFLFLTMFIIWWTWQAIRFLRDIPSLNEMYNFYHHLLEIPDKDMQTVSWQQILARIVDIRETNPNTARSSPLRLNEHDVANRIMRKDNYLIALFNKDVLNITIPLPYLRHKYMFTRDLEWNLSFCVLSYVFDERGQVRKRFLRQKNRPLLVAGLRRRFIFMALLNLVFTPFILVYLVVYFFFRYFEEFRKNPSEIGSRSYSPFAKWKFREFNELPHLVRGRISSSVPIANKYIDQFPKEKTALMARFVAFITGSIAGVLLILTLFDSEALVNFELTANRTIFFYMGIFGAIFEISRRMIPDEHLIFEPEILLRQVVEHTHYFPSEWHGQLHTDEVRAQFCQLFDYKVSLFLQELISVIFTPVILGFSLPSSAEQIVDFFREFSVHVDGLGYVCSFAQFDFERHGNVKYGAPTKIEDDYYLSKEGKMEKSFINFKANNPNWEPNEMSGSMYLSRLTAFQNTKNRSGEPSRRATPLQTNESPKAWNDDVNDDDGDEVDHDYPQTMGQHGQLHQDEQQQQQQQQQQQATTDDEDIMEQAYSPTGFAFQRTHFVPTIQPSSMEFSEPPSTKPPPTQLNQYGVPEGRIPSNLGDSFERPRTDAPLVGNMNNGDGEDEDDDDEILDPNQVPGMMGLLNQFYDLNNKPTV